MAGTTPGAQIAQNAQRVNPQISSRLNYANLSPQQRAAMQGGPTMTTGTAMAPGNMPNVTAAQWNAMMSGGAQSPLAAATGAQHPAAAAGGGQQANPLQPSYLPNAPQGVATTGRATTGQATTGRATTGNAATLSPQQIAALGPQSTLQQILAGFEPQARQAQDALNNSLAAAGIVGGGQIGATQALQGQLASSLAPTLANAIQTSQGNVLGAETGNQNALNAMTGMNVGALNQQTLANQAAQNAQTGQNVGAINTQTLANQGAQNAMTGMNVGNVMNTNLANQQAANAARTNLAQMLMTGWQTPLEAMSGLYGAGLSGGAGLAGQEAQNFAVPPPQNLITQLLGGL